MRKLFGMIAGLVLACGAVVGIQSTAAANTGIMNFAEFGNIYLGETKAFVEVNDLGGDGANCDCTGTVVRDYQNNGYYFLSIRYTGSNGNDAFVTYRSPTLGGTYHARQKFWNTTEYSMPTCTTNC